ncbi:hypothetical protein AGDE_13255 [Angomonas deanei]|uniref:Translin-associated factor X-interacting N-terminus, putative n=1 Tax=Angomonas deanei TaxID=59799 RepID=A0A7G2CGL4_9TRYP|nr:hypothetical protein AGDE_13255 [Angomonas deanei]CAD2218014.1 Translin-associated factor X-interacting N-terminus, putative [Angomonas deanei]|eukprot:EPY22544.1 hypothetical protein AGDE_13255 [Angomonas deanei]
MHSTHSSRNNTPPPRGLQYITPTSQLSQTYSGKGTSGGGNRAHPTLPSLVSSSKPQPDVVSPPLTSSVKQLLHMDDVVPPAPKQTREATKFSESMPVTRSTGFNTTFGASNTKKESTYNTTFNKTTSSRLVPPGQRGAVSSTPPPLATSLRAYLDKEARYNSFISESPETRLEPYREVFGALGEAFPNYAQIFDEIRTAYDAVVQQQATRIVELNSAARTDELRTRQNNDDVQTLQQHIDALQGDLAAMRKELEERESKTQTLNKDAAAVTKQVYLDRNSESEALDIAKRRVAGAGKEQQRGPGKDSFTD